MRRVFLALSLALFALSSAAPAAASCPLCVDGAAVQTPDGQAWSDGKPVTLVVSAHRGDADAQFPATGLAVIMLTDSERTKCLDVPLKLVSTSGDGGLYAGVFYPFRAAIYDGKAQLGDDAANTFDITFDVKTLVAAAPAAATAPIATTQLPVAIAEQQSVDTLSSVLGAAPFAAVVLAFWSAVAYLVVRRQPRPRMA